MERAFQDGRGAGAEGSNGAARDCHINLSAASQSAVLLGRNCRARRAALKISQTDLAAKSGIAASHLSRIENGRGNPTLEILVAVADALQCSVGELLSRPTLPAPSIDEP